MSWSVSKLMCSLRLRRGLHWLPRTLPGRSPSFFISVTDPVVSGLVDSLARPGGNITGFTIISAVLAGKRLELLKETIPKLSRVALLWNPQNPGSAQHGKKANWRHENWVCNFIPWR